MRATRYITGFSINKCTMEKTTKRYIDCTANGQQFMQIFFIRFLIHAGIVRDGFVDWLSKIVLHVQFTCTVVTCTWYMYVNVVSLHSGSLEV